MNNTTEQYLHMVRQAIVEHAKARGTITPEQAHRIMHAKLLYGVGDGTYRGICEDVDGVYLAVALPGAGDRWVRGQEIVKLPGMWPAKRVDNGAGPLDREPRDAAALFAVAWLGEQPGRVALVVVTRAFGMTLQTYEVI